MTLESLGRQVVLILGGRSKGLDFGELNPTIKKYAQKVIITGENAKEIYGAIGNESNAIIIESFEEAIKEGVKLARNVGALLLSPASTSYDLFRNYAERGERFNVILKELYKL
jgi:UDP-N-acetylmuramoylalanine--D-glutamate ligase